MATLTVPVTADQEHCKKCKKIAQEPITSCCCGESFCRKCITESVDNEGVCPHCGSDDVGLAEQRKRYSLVLDVSCPGVDLGCQWFGDKDEYDDHVAQCEYVVIKCELCGQEMRRRYIKPHREENCPKTLLECPKKCGNQIKRNDLEDHTKTCGIVVVERFQLVLDLSCPGVDLGCQWFGSEDNYDAHVDQCEYVITECKLCEQEMRRRYINPHLEESCPETLQECPKKCGAYFKRKNLEAHAKNCGQEECIIVTMIQCPKNCGKQFTQEDFEAHVESCGQQERIVVTMVECPKKCGKLFKREDLEAHIETCERDLDFVLIEMEQLPPQKKTVQHTKRSCYCGWIHFGIGVGAHFGVGVGAVAVPVDLGGSGVGGNVMMFA